MLKCTCIFRIKYSLRNIKSKNELLVEGQNVILFEIIQDYISKIVSIDEKNAPFEIIDLEGDNKDGYTKQIMINSDFCVNSAPQAKILTFHDGFIQIAFDF